MDKSIDGLSYEDRLELLKANRIGLWDAFHTCFRPGSMDADITARELNDFAVLKGATPNIRLICFNGKGAANAGDVLARLGYQTRLLPSSSGANRRDQEGRLGCWKSAIQFIATDFNEEPGLSPELVLPAVGLSSHADAVYEDSPQRGRHVRKPASWPKNEVEDFDF